MRTLIFLIATLFYSSAVHGACLDSWHKYGNSCYGFATEILSWGEAQAMCHAYGGSLAVINSEVEATFLKQVAQGKGEQYYWIGATDVFHHGSWAWINGGGLVEYGYTDWYRTEPAGLHYACMVMRRAFVNYQWQSLPCTQLHHSICEMADVTELQ